jgi:endonuclease/exonuclease/phosphatase family metal-dependent hydrolase
MLQVLLIPLILFLACTTGCRKARAMEPPKAVPVVIDGRLELQLMSFNLRYENPEDRGQRAWQERVIGTVRMIRDEAPDVFGVQEALHGQVADLRSSLPDYEFFGVGRDDGLRNGEYAGLFFRRDRFEPDLADRGTFWLSDTPERAGSKTWGNDIPRVASWLRLVDRTTQRGVYAFVTHWDHRNQPSREQAALLMARRIDSRKHRDEPVVLLGDLNATENNPGVAYLTGNRATLAGSDQTWKHSLIDTFKTLHPKASARTTLHFWKGSREGFLKVDHILVSQGAKVISAQIRDHDKPMLSDHFPFTARVVFPESSESLPE